MLYNHVNQSFESQFSIECFVMKLIKMRSGSEISLAREQNLNKAKKNSKCEKHENVIKIIKSTSNATKYKFYRHFDHPLALRVFFCTTQNLNMIKCQPW